MVSAFLSHNPQSASASINDFLYFSGSLSTSFRKRARAGYIQLDYVGSQRKAKPTAVLIILALYEQGSQFSVRDNKSLQPSFKMHNVIVL